MQAKGYGRAIILVMEGPASAVAERMRVALEMYEIGLNLMRQNLRRQFPQATPTEIEHHLLEWRLRRTDAPHGDAVGRVVSFPR